MLREYAYGNDELKAILARFKLDDQQPVVITMFKMISPDSFIWRLRIGEKGTYYLYAEDFIRSLEEVKRNIQAVAGTHPGEFVEALQPKDFKDTKAVAGATVYESPEEADKVKKYAVDSGYDLVFLWRIK